MHAPDPFRRAARRTETGPDPGAAPAERAASFPAALLREAAQRPDQLARVLSFPVETGERLVSAAAVQEDHLLEVAARHFGAAEADLSDPVPAVDLIDRLGVKTCLRHGLVPWRRIGAATVVATAQPETFARLRPMLEDQLGPVVMALAPTARIEAAIHARRGTRLAALAETRVPEAESCRTYGRLSNRGAVALAVLAALTLGLLAPLAAFAAVVAVTTVTLAINAGMKLAAALSALRAPAAEHPAPGMAQPPHVSLIVALYRESDIAPRLVRRLSRLTYRRDRLDVLLAVEADDTQTRAALEESNLPPWMRVVVVPAGQLRTKPRALNFALDHCRGSIIGVYDAEDAPEPDQILKVVDLFHRRGPDLACVQGVLDYYNPRTNWMSRCFTIEYAAWFRLMLPGIARLGLVVPLGGTTLFFRRSVLEELGAWDAHNVTEDADLGVRLARHGYRTEVLDTVTQEEANCHFVPWVKQRSRWIKGYMVTWAVHMRDPVLLWRQLGAKRFAGFQVMFLGTVIQHLFAPVLWSFWLLWLGVGHPLLPLLSAPVMAGLMTVFLSSEAITIAMGVIALRRSEHRLSPLWVPTLHLYYPFSAVAAYKALWELVARPFYWDKTRHGIHDHAAPQD